MPTDRDALSLDLHALAVEEHFLDELRAGKRPRLSAYIRRYPAHAEALTNLVASLAPDTITERSSDATLTARAWAEAGERRALTVLFGALPAESAGNDVLRVAEERGEYTVGRTPDASPPAKDTDTKD